VGIVTLLLNQQPGEASLSDQLMSEKNYKYTTIYLNPYIIFSFGFHVYTLDEETLRACK